MLSNGGAKTSLGLLFVWYLCIWLVGIFGYELKAFTIKGINGAIYECN